ncbi:MAG: IscS subfamily cysteine desulfurase [Bacteroidetes bacterium GWF2_43_63]|nr:MAG: IscS subfamily cysteine desulfurase [Bacteroidetes bacterium GWE2_42_42]OFY56347.1 MAG: IscS subfamily cysteine desulfurase [Bacteroidetes bacterium GWF2_43_63]HBG69691.1 IscS subfamily cysteine desulfurase [Bacteroidales bacterium]HCB61958.1 IscS subfamily cysteine desulfurase [Bacteroidales bacterium]HCY42263.1 IscS subfamily cysteine desulfurase [Prolixibacteraceae bacterium]
MHKNIYLDYNSTTPTDSRVLEAMLPFFHDQYANASSIHILGQNIKKTVESAKVKISNLLKSDINEIILTSGATESINLIIKGYAFANLDKGNHIITLSTEHKAVLDTCKYLETVGFEVSFLPVSDDGIIDLNILSKEIRKETILISVMLVNNEIGVIQPIKEISEIAHANNIAFFCDATQAVGKIETLVDELGIDFMAFSGHKFYAPKGIGGLYIRGLGEKNIKIQPLLHGGGHEKGLRSGTLNVPGIIGLGKACEIAMIEMNENKFNIEALRNKLEMGLLAIPNTSINGSIKSRIYNVTNICFHDIEASVLIGKLKNIAVSNGSACSSAIIEPSHVLQSIGLSYNDAMSSIRFSLGKFNTKEEIETTVRLINEFITVTRSSYA